MSPVGSKQMSDGFGSIAAAGALVKKGRGLGPGQVTGVGWEIGREESEYGMLLSRGVYGSGTRTKRGFGSGTQNFESEGRRPMLELGYPISGTQ